MIDGDSCIVWDILNLKILFHGKLALQEAETESMAAFLGAPSPQDFLAS